MHFQARGTLAPRTHLPYLAKSYSSAPSSVATIRNKIEKYEQLYDKIYQSEKQPIDKYEQYKRKIKQQMEEEIQSNAKKVKQKQITEKDKDRIDGNSKAIKKFNYMEMFNQEMRKAQENNQEEGSTERQQKQEKIQGKSQEKSQEKRSEASNDKNQGKNSRKSQEKSHHYHLSQDKGKNQNSGSKLDQKLSPKQQKIPSQHPNTKHYQSTNDSAQQQNDDSLDHLDIIPNEPHDELEITEFNQKEALHFSAIQQLKVDLFRLMELESKLDEKIKFDQNSINLQLLNMRSQDDQFPSSLEDSLEKIKEKDLHNETATFQQCNILIREQMEEFSFSNK